MQSKPLRPMGVTVLGVLAILIGLLGIAGGAVLLTSSDMLVVGLSAFAIIVGLLYLVTGVGFFQGAKWGWILGLVVSVLSLVRNLVEVASGAIVFAIPGVIVALVIIYYLTRPEVKTFFGRSSVAPTQ